MAAGAAEGVLAAEFGSWPWAEAGTVALETEASGEDEVSGVRRSGPGGVSGAGWAGTRGTSGSPG